MRGPDTYKRKRRTKLEILAERAAKQGGTEKAAELDAAIERALIQAVPEVKQGGIQYIQLDSPTVTEDAKNALDNEALALKISRKVSDQVFAELEVKTNAILKRVESLSAVKQVAIAIKINDGELRKLSNAAHPQLAEALAMIKMGILPLLVGPAGCGKTYLAGQVAEALKLEFGHLCFTAGASETWLFGRQTPSGFINGDFARLYEHGGVFLADEIDAADPNLLLALNTALANGHLYNPIAGKLIPKHKDFHFIGAANTVGKGANGAYSGRNRLDAATLDRFRIIRVDYDSHVERALLPIDSLRERLQKLRKGVIDRGASEVLSYRAFGDAYKLTMIGYDEDRIVKCLTEAWPDDLRKEIEGGNL